jgi:GT2 family glycosyltransferase
VKIVDLINTSSGSDPSTAASTLAQATAVPDMSIVLVCWNNKDYLDQCLQSLYAGSLKSSYDVIVVDNGSKDGSQQMLREKYPQVKRIQNDSNVGLGRASNQGIEATQGRFVLLLNNDTIVKGTALDTLVEFMAATPDAGAVGGKLVNPDGTFQAGYAEFSTLVEEFLIATGLGNRLWEGFPSHEDTDDVKVVGWLSSACLLLRRATLDMVGLLDDSYFIYGDEADLQYRIKRAGWKVYYLPSAVTIHYGGRSLDHWRRRKLVYRGKMLFYKKNYGELPTLALRGMFLILSAAKMLVWSLAWLMPNKKDRARQELRSNVEVIKLCWRLE